MKTPGWIPMLQESIPRWLETVAVPKQPGRFYPCLEGRTKVGEAAALGFSCFALKIYCIMGVWEQLGAEQRKKWVEFIQSFQRAEPVYQGAFVDPPILNHCEPWRNKIMSVLLRRGHPGLSRQEGTRIAETKQAIATLAQVDVQTSLPFKGFPQTAEEIRHYLRNKLNWSRPWAAGGQAAALAVFVSHEAPRFLSNIDVRVLKREMQSFFNEIVDPKTGGWCVNRRASHGELINGAMKVLNALEWLDAKIPYPARLIDTCLSGLPRAEGCHLADAVYVLYRCSQYTAHRRQDVMAYCSKILEMIAQHRQSDGAFSYFLSHNQTHYYGARIAVPMRQSDIHGTVLLVWALSMIDHLLELGAVSWEVIKA